MSRRKQLLLGATIFTILLFLQHWIVTPPPKKPLGKSRPDEYKLPAKITRGPDNWADLPTRYPVTDFVPLPTSAPSPLPSIQARTPEESSEERETRLYRQGEVKKAFVKCWSSYRQHAWIWDEIRPVSGRGFNTFSGWGATLVDSLDTLYLMNMTDEFDDAVKAVSHLDFSYSEDGVVNIFETTIRYLGGLLGAYDLSGKDVLLKKAAELGEMLYIAFDTPNRMPVTRWVWRKGVAGDKQEAGENTLLAEIGSLTLEFTRLSQLTGNPKWHDATNRIMIAFAEQQSKTALPGLWPVLVNAADGNFTSDNSFSLSGMSDSMYEYLAKQYMLSGGSPIYKDMYMMSVDAAMQHLFFRPMVSSLSNVLFSGNAQAGRGGRVSLDPQVQHLTCFVGGMLAVGARLFENDTHLDAARRLVDGCIWAYGVMPTGIMPEIFNVVPCESATTCKWEESAWKYAISKRFALVQYKPEVIEKAIKDERLPEGVTHVVDRRYGLRPEAIESIFILYRVAGDKALQETAWRMFENIMAYTEAQYGYAGLSDVTDPQSSKIDKQESFWMAETLKYFYLVFSEFDLLSLDEWVLNTEAHPFRRPR